MTTFPIPNHEALKAEIGEQDALSKAIAEMERRANDAVSQESRSPWIHATILCRSGWSVPRVLHQLQYHATRGRDEDAGPVKAAAYREAFALLMELTGEKPSKETAEKPFELCAT